VHSPLVLDSAAAFERVKRQGRKRPALPWLLAMAAAVGLLAMVWAVVCVSPRDHSPTAGPETLRSQSEPVPVPWSDLVSESSSAKSTHDSTTMDFAEAPPAGKLSSVAGHPPTVVIPGRLGTILELIDPGKPGEPDPL
jgi:hypothetical protein